MLAAAFSVTGSSSSYVVAVPWQVVLLVFGGALLIVGTGVAILLWFLLRKPKPRKLG